MSKERSVICPDSRRFRLGRLALQIGEPGFADALAELMRAMADADHVLVMNMEGERPVPIFAASLSDLGLIERAGRRFLEDFASVDPLVEPVRLAARSATPQLFRVDVGDTPHRELFALLDGAFPVRERLLIAGRSAQVNLAVSLIRLTEQKLRDEAADEIIAWAPVILALVASHARLSGRLADTSRAFESAAAIEQRLERNGAILTQRQRQVSARILLGMSTEGIALDLGIGIETVVTHRKQAYQRLGVGNHFDLTRWYLAQLSLPAL